jgi:hypothetical protein
MFNKKGSMMTGVSTFRLYLLRAGWPARARRTHLEDKVSPLILIVHDDDSARSILVETLKGEGSYLERLVRACQQRKSAG